MLHLPDADQIRQTARRRAVGVRRKQVQTRRGPLHCVDEGFGPPVLVCHGDIGDYRAPVELVTRYVGPRVRVLGASVPGFGSAQRDVTPVDQADDAVALLDRLGIDWVVALGFSAGGLSALRLAVRHAERLRGLILASACLPVLRPHGEVEQPRMHAAQPHALEKLTIPTLIVHAADDPVAAYEHACSAARRIAGARLATIAQGGHAFLGQEDQVRELTSGFIRNVVRRELRGE